MRSTDRHSFKLMVGVVIGTIIALLVGVTLYQVTTSKSQGEIRARAADPCESYPKLSPIVTDEGIVHDKTDNGFNWWQNGISTKVKVVIVCAGAKITRQFGATIPYSDVREGDRVAMTGNYGDTTKSTILATWVRNMSTSVAKETGVNAKVATVNPSDSSFTLSAVMMKVAGKYGPYTLNVNYTPTTNCYFRTKNKPLACSSIAVGNRAAVTGIVYDPTITMTATSIVIDY